MAQSKSRLQPDEEHLRSIINKLVDLFEEIVDEDIDILVMLNDNRVELSVFHSASCPRCMAELLTESLDANNIKHVSDSQENITKH